MSDDVMQLLRAVDRSRAGLRALEELQRLPVVPQALQTRVARVCHEVLRYEDRLRREGEAPLSSLWREAARLLVRCGAAARMALPRLDQLLQRSEVDFERDPMYAGMEAVQIAVIEVLAVLAKGPQGLPKVVLLTLEGVGTGRLGRRWGYRAVGQRRMTSYQRAQSPRVRERACALLHRLGWEEVQPPTQELFDPWPERSDEAWAALLRDERAPESLRADAMLALARTDGTELGYRALIEALDATPTGDPRDRLAHVGAHTVVVAGRAGGALAPWATTARAALLRRASRYDHPGASAAGVLPELLVREDAQGAQREEAALHGDEAVLAWAEEVLRFEAPPPARPSAVGEPSAWLKPTSRWDLYQSAAARSVELLAPRLGGRERLAPLLNHWLCEDACPTLPFDSVTGPVLRALDALGPLTAESRSTLEQIALHGGRDFTRRIHQATRGEAAGLLLKKERDEDLALSLAAVIEGWALSSSVDASIALGAVLWRIPWLPLELAEPLLLLAARGDRDRMGEVVVLCTQPPEPGRAPLPPGLVWPVIEERLKGDPEDRLSTIDSLARLALAGVEGAEAALRGRRRDRSSRVREEAHRYEGRLARWRKAR